MSGQAVSVVTGGATGFIGRAVTQRLSALTCSVYTAGRNVGSSSSATATNASDFSFDPSSPELLAAWLQDVSPAHLVHAAGRASVADSMQEPHADFLANVSGTASVLEAIRLSGLDIRAYLLSSAAVYGNPPVLPVPETSPTHPLSAYGFNKVMSEITARKYASLFGMRVTILRVFSVIGPEQRRLLPFELWSRAKTESKITLRGSGTESRDFLHVDDLAAAVAQLTERAAAPDLEILNLGSGVETVTAEIATAVRARVAPSKEIECLNQELAGDPVRWRADVARLKAEIPTWRPRDFMSALEDCLDVWDKDDE